ncbi:MAG: helix-turn-helix domain-containing protein [Acidimicrobiales bacterium]
MDRAHSTRQRIREHPGHHHAGPWRPAPDGPEGAPAERSEHVAELLTGDRLALTVSEAASLLGISRALGYELVARGELPSIRLGRRLVVPKVALLEMLGLRPRGEA